MARVYLTEAVLSFGVLGIAHHTISLVLAFFLLSLACVSMLPERRTLGRMLSLTAGYLFLLSNMSLVTGYLTAGILEIPPYSLEMSILLDILLSLLGVYVSSVWERLPQDRDSLTIRALRKMQAYLTLCMAGLFLCLLFFLFCTDKIAVPEQADLLRVVTEGAKSLHAALADALFGGLLGEAFRQYGLIGLLAALALWVLACAKLASNRRFLLRENHTLTILGIAALFLLLLYPPSPLLFLLTAPFFFYSLQPTLTYR